MLFGGDLSGQLMLLLFLLLEEIIAPRLKSGKSLIDPPRLAPVDPHRRPRQIRKEPPVVADQHQRRAQGFQFPFQPFDHRQVEMVGGLVQQQDIRLGRQNPRQRRPPRLPAGKRIGRFLARQPQLLEQILRPVRFVSPLQPRFHIGQRRLVPRKVRLLGQIAHGRARLLETLAPIGLDNPRRNLEQRGFARPIAPHQRDLVPRAHGKLGPFE